MKNQPTQRVFGKFAYPDSTNASTLGCLFYKGYFNVPA